MECRPEFPYKGFEDLPIARTWTGKFVHWYNCEHQHSGLIFVTPEQCHTGVYIDVLKNRDIVYEQAKQKHPERWSRGTRDWRASQISGVKSNERFYLDRTPSEAR
jgi:putative transposase